VRRGQTGRDGTNVPAGYPAARGGHGCQDS
jgi:hypothetical protein